MAGHVFFVQALEEEVTVEQKNIIKQRISHLYDIQDNLVFTDDSNVSELYLEAYRLHRLHKNERQTVLSYDGTMVAIQLCLAKLHKQDHGDFDVEISKVIQFYNKHVSECILEARKHNCNDATSDSLPDGDGEDNEDDAIESSLSAAYKEMLGALNVVDFVTVFTDVLEEIRSNEELKKYWESLSLVVTTPVCNEIESEMLKYICQDKPCHSVHMELPLNDECSLGGATVRVHDLTGAEVCDMCEITNVVQSSVSATENYITSVMLSYIEMIVNTRNELALARVINVPDRDLDHEAFTDLKREATTRKMPLYQTAVSYVLRVRLGGRGYKPDQNACLNKHIKGLSEFVDMMHKLSQIVEEEPNTRTATRKVINIIKNTFIKSKENKLRKASIENVAERMHNVLEAINSKVESTDTMTTPKSAGRGGSVLGRCTMNTLRILLDHCNSQPSAVNNVQILDDVYTSQKTPVRLPCLMSQFRSPEFEPVDSSSPEQKTLAQRVAQNLKPKESTKNAGVQRYQSCLDWCDDSSKNADDVELFRHIAPLDISDEKIDDEIIATHVEVEKDGGKPAMIDKINTMSKAVTFMKDKSSSAARKVVESIKDQENVGSIPAVKPKKNSKKRPLEDKDSTTAKKPKITTNTSNPASKKNISKKKPIAQIQGQKSLASFFRV